MDKPNRKKRLAPRTRSGCLPCRQHHRKCDEEHPACGLCRKNMRTCQYGPRIVWGGRPFQKSVFGQCILDQSVVVEYSDRRDVNIDDGRSAKSFVYRLARIDGERRVAEDEMSSTSPTAHPSPETIPSPQRRPASKSIDQWDKTTVSSMLSQVPSLSLDLPPVYRPLLDYFSRVADSFSCHEVVKMDLYATFMPIAIETSLVMTALLNLAAVHRLNSGLGQSDKQVTLLQTMAIQQLRSKLSGPLSIPTEAVMASIILLCYSEIVSGSYQSHSWRLHLEGAASLLGNDRQGWNINALDSTRAFLSRCFVSLAALANVSGYPPSDMVSQQATHLLGGNDQIRYIDEFTGFSTGLVPIFVEIGSLLRRRDKILQHDPESLEVRAVQLIQKVHRMMDNGCSGLRMKSSTTMSPTRRQEYLYINESYHQAALIHLYQRLRRMPSSSDQVQTSVRRILALLANVKLLNGPCPGITRGQTPSANAVEEHGGNISSWYCSTWLKGIGDNMVPSRYLW
ncbi:fungal-specific transcription factor domain-containing protein [Thelonectria olida]|uniref:Fungal-specific transcription factor domain-containing protein n=1 Tax=Thelonectria olida TaxID=1576542 RepID=A0A9P8W5W5_9HYPO|nr:fungal-specific transcription factor domain-containing protein [Thelonectria olida]